MPKIPLYAEGRGSAVDLATGRLGPQAPTGAFEAPGQATVRAAEALGRVGTEYAKNAMQFENARQKLEFDFQMQRKNEQTKTLSNQYTTRAYEQSDTYTLNSQEPDQDKAVSGLISSVQAPILTEIDTLDITDSQKTAIKDSVLKQMNFKVADAKKSAFRISTIQGAEAKSGKLSTIQSQISSASTYEEYAALAAEAMAIFDDAALSGQNLGVSKNAFKQESLRLFYGNGIANADSFASLERQRTNVSGDNTLSSATKKTLIASIDSRDTQLESEKQDEIIGTLLTANLSKEETESALAQLTSEGSQMIYIKRDDPEDDVLIEYDGAGNKFLARVASRFEQDVKSLAAQNNNDLVNQIFPTIAGMDRDELNQLIDEADTLTGRFDGADRSIAALLTGDANRRLDTMDAELSAEIKADMSAIEIRTISLGGIFDETTQTMIASVDGRISQLTDNEVQRTLFNETMDGMRQAGVLYSSIKYGGPSDLTAVRRSIRDEINDPTNTPEDIRIAEARRKHFEALVDARQTAIANDPVKFIQDDRADQNLEAATTSQLIDFQRKMGIPDVDIRVASDAQIDAFQGQFKDPSLSYNDKSKLGISFITSFGVENEGRVMRNLMNQGVLTLADTWIIANPNNAGGFDIEAANKPGVVKELKSAIGTSSYNEIMQEVMVQNAEYSGSIVGGAADSIVSRGATGSRMLHVTAMNTMIQNTAAYYMNAGETDLTKAVERAVDTVVNSQFAFDEVNGKPFRMLKGLEGSSSQIGDILQFYVNDDETRGVIAGFADIPPANDLTPDQAREKYQGDLAQAYWVTSSDHKTVYLVDQTGNMVKRRVDPGPTAISPQDAFVTIKMSDLLPVIKEMDELYPRPVDKLNEIMRKAFK
jgi:hypothetical protein